MQSDDAASVEPQRVETSETTAARLAGQSDAGQQLWRRSVESPGFVAAAIAFAVVTLRVGLAARGNGETAKALIEAAGAPTVVIATLADSFGVLVLLLAVLMWFWLRRPGQLSLVGSTSIAFSTLGLVALATVQVLYLVIFGVVIALSIFVNTRQKQPVGWPIIGMIVTLLSSSFFIDRGVWLPIEQITMDKGETFVGYVVKEGDPFTTVLRDEDRVILRVRTDDIDTRRICRRPSDERGRTLPELLRGANQRPHYPTCKA